MPPSHSHWSITHGQIRAVTAAASCGEACSDVREVERSSGTDPDLVWSDPPAAADRLGPDHRDRDDGGAGLEREPPDALAGLGRATRAHARPLEEDEDDLAALEQLLRGRDRVGVGGAAIDRERAEALRIHASSRFANSSFLAT